MREPIKEAAIAIAEDFLLLAEQSLKDKYGEEFSYQNVDAITKIATLYAMVFNTCLSRSKDQG